MGTVLSAKLGRHAFEAYCNEVGDYGKNGKEEPRDGLIDLLADLRHFALEEGLCWEDTVRIANNHFTAEQAGLD